jgi:flagellar biosynthesis GTPase FlhF
MLGALRFIPRDSVPAVVSQNHSEADEKRGSNNKDDTAKRKDSARKERKSEHRVKRKKHRKSKKDEESSEGSSDDDDDDDEGSDGAKNRTEEHQAKQEVRRKEAGLEWMTQAPERPAPVVVESEDVHTLEGEKPQSSVKELNPYWKSAGNGLPSEGDTGGLQKGGRSGLPPPPGVGDGGASWRLKALKRAQEQAAREGRQLDEVY